MNVIADPAPLTAAPLWARIRAAYARAVAAIGAPAAIAALGLLSRKLRRAIANRIALLEHIARKLLLAEAGRLDVRSSFRGVAQRRTRNPGASDDALAPGFRIALTRVRNDERCVRSSKFDLARPETWPARFALAPPRDPGAVPEARAPRIRALWGATPSAQPQPNARRAPRAADAAFRLARRFEALRRVLDDPLPHAVKLARLLTRLRQRYPEAPLRFAAAPARTSTFDHDDPRLGVDAIGASFASVYVFSDSS